MSGFLIGLAVTAVVGYLIVKKYQPHAVLLIAGLFLLAMTAILFPETSILFKKAKSTGWIGFDVFAYVKESLAYRAAGLGMIIMAAGGFAKYMDHIGATDAMVAVCIKPLKLLKAPYLVLALGYAVGQVLNIFIPSAAGLAMLLLVTFYPTLVRLGVSRAAAAAMIGTTAVLDLGPRFRRVQPGGQDGRPRRRRLFRQPSDPGRHLYHPGHLGPDLFHGPLFRQTRRPYGLGGGFTVRGGRERQASSRFPPSTPSCR